MYKLSTIWLVLLLISMPLHAGSNADYQLFDKLFAKWSDAFNHKNTIAACALFDKSLKADYQGAPTKSYASICDGFKKVFAMPNQNYHYQFELHDVYRSGDLAAIRITWYLTLNDNGHVTKTQDEGIDIFKRDKSGEWKIVNYLAYPASKRT